MRSVNASSEELSYIPWVRMTNTALWALRDKSVPGAKPYNEKIDLIHLTNDPNTLKFKLNNTESIRKPDTVFVPRAVASMLYGQEDWLELAKTWSVVPPTRGARKGKEKEKEKEGGRLGNGKGKGKGNGRRRGEGKGKGKGKDQPAPDLPALDWGDALSCVEHKRKRKFKPKGVDVQPPDCFAKELHDFKTVLAREHLLDVRNTVSQGPLSNPKKRKREEHEDEDEDEDEDETKDEKRPPKKRRRVNRE